jgi:hypothetical protein
MMPAAMPLLAYPALALSDHLNARRPLLSDGTCDSLF